MRLVFFIIAILGLNEAVGQLFLQIDSTDRRRGAYPRAVESIKNNPSSPQSVKTLNFMSSDLPYDQAVELFRGIDSSLASLNDYHELKQQIEARRLTMPGVVIKDIQLKSISGSSISLGDIARSHKLLLIDVWSSKCIPCRQNIGFIKSLEAYFSKEGLAVVGISTDKSEEEWKAAVSQDGSFAFYHAIDDSAESFQKQFGVLYIPAYILVDSNLKVIERFSGRWYGKEALAQAIQAYLQVI